MDRGVLATASELYKARHYPEVVAVCTEALDQAPECVPFLLLRAHAHVGLRCDLDAQADLRDVIRLDPQCAAAYRLLGVLAARSEERESAAVFFRESLRLDPGDQEAADWLLRTDASLRPAAVAQKLPAPATAAGRFPPAPARRPESEPRLARGTRQPVRFASDDGASPPYDERPTRPFARGSERQGGGWAPSPKPTPAQEPLPAPPSLARVESSAPPQRRPSLRREPTQDLAQAAEEVIPLVKPKLGELATIRGRAVSDTPPAKQAPRLGARLTRSSIPELPGFGEYLVSQGILTRDRLRAAQAYQRSMRVQLSTAIVTLGLATPQRIEWASVSHQSQLSRGS